MPKGNAGGQPGDAEIDKLVERAAEAKRTADQLIQQMQELAREVERLKAKRQKDPRSRRKP